MGRHSSVRVDRTITAEMADGARAGRLYRRAREIEDLQRIAADSLRHGRAFDLERAERTLARIEAVARGDWEGER
jgi:hypothetical protein